MRQLMLLCAVLAALLVPTQAQVTSFTANSPQYNWNVLPGSLRRVNVNCSGCTTNLVNWSVASTTGGASATLASGSFPWVDVTIGAAYGTCSIGGTVGAYSVTSTATVTVQAQSQDDLTKTTSFIFNVCAPTTEVRVVPGYRQAFQGQLVNLQSFVAGNTSLGVTWSILSQPAGGDGTLADTSNRDAVFNASVQGEYTIKATSTADSSKSDSAIVYVASTTAPYNVTASNTEPVPCEIDSALTGTDFEIGPGKAYSTIGAALLASGSPAIPGSIYRVWNTDVTGTSPTTYNEFVEIRHGATKTQPQILCGVPDSTGHLPVIEAASATGQSYIVAGGAAAGYGAVSVWEANPGGSHFYPVESNMGWVTISGLKVKDASATNAYFKTDGSGSASWVLGASCINIRRGIYISVIGNEITACDNGVFSDFSDSNFWEGGTRWVLYEGNWIHGNGNTSSQHQLYIQSWGQVVQFNRIESMRLVSSLGSNLKMRGVMEVVRYNYLGDGSARQVDMVDNQDSTTYLTFETRSGPSGEYFLGPNGAICGQSFYCQGDGMSADKLAGYQEAWQSHFFYGNVIHNTTSASLIHFNGDHDNGLANRQGTLFAYDNTLFHGYSGSNGVFDTDDNGGGTPYQYQKVAFWNNILWLGTQSTKPCWNRVPTFIGDFKTNLNSSWYDATTTPIAGAACNTITTPWSTTPSGGPIAYFPLTSPLDNHLTGITAGNFLTDTIQPFDGTSYAPLSGHSRSGTALSGGASGMPVRFNYLPSVSYAIARATPVTASSGGIVGAIDNVVMFTLSTAVSGIGSGSISGCAGTLEPGTAYNCTITPAPGSVITSVVGCSGSGGSIYAGIMPVSNCTVIASFAIQPGSSWQGITLNGTKLQ